MRGPAVTTVRNGEVVLAVTERPGQEGGPALVLMHGLGTTGQSMARVAELLPGWRVVTLDLRGHGGSSTGPWDFAQAVGDVVAVVDELGLVAPYVGGHSLGGMVALQYALAGRPVAGVVNIDGWGPGVAHRYLGEDPAVVDAWLDRVATGSLPPAARALASLSRQSREGTTRQVLRALDRVDVVAWHAALSCPTLALHAVAPAGRGITVLMGRRSARLQDAYRKGLSRDLTALAAEHPAFRLVEVDATHRLHTTHPAVVAGAVLALHADRG